MYSLGCGGQKTWPLSSKLRRATTWKQEKDPSVLRQGTGHNPMGSSQERRLQLNMRRSRSRGLGVPGQTGSARESTCPASGAAPFGVSLWSPSGTSAHPRCWKLQVRFLRSLFRVGSAF